MTTVSVQPTTSEPNEREAFSIKSKEHYELMLDFEKQFKGKRLDRESNKELWAIGQVYESGEVNILFLAFRRGYELGKLNERFNHD
jgi:hypothetical protein